MTHFFTLTRVPQDLTTFIAESGLGYFGIVTSMVIFYIILGMFLEAMSMMLITIPILYPIATAAGIDPLSFGIFVVLAIEAAQITPPVGINLFTVSQVGKIPFETIVRSIEIGRTTSELQSLMRISYAVFCLTKKTLYN